MDIRQLKYFVGIAETRSLTEASRRLHVVQPALSQRLGDLEKGLGVQLVVRGRSGTALTPAGRELYERAKIILKQIEYAAVAVRDKAGLVEGVLSIGLLSTISSALGARLFSEIRRQMPGVRPQIRVGYSEELEALVVQGKLDLATLVVPTTSAGQGTPVITEALYLVGTAEILNELPFRPRLKDITSVPLLLSPVQPAHRLVIDAADRLGIELDVLGGTEDVRCMLELCEQGLGITILSASAATRAAVSGSLAVTPIAEPGLERNIRLTVQKDACWSAAVVLSEAILDKLLHEALTHCRPEQSRPRFHCVQ